MTTPTTRREHDLIGDRDVPAEGYWGVHTARALENFPITGTAISAYPHLVRALASVKGAAALANAELGLLDAAVKAPPPPTSALGKVVLVPMTGMAATA